ncbi:MAG: aminopeptidase N [Bdellovibrionota bacterium]
MRILSILFFLAPGLSLAAPRPSIDNLDRDFAKLRREQIRSVSYQLHFTFTGGREEFSGDERIETDLADTAKPLSLDWLGPAPVSLTVNGTEIHDYRTAVGWLEIPARYLRAKTEIAINFHNSFSKEGEGIQHVVDPEDKTEYVYTDFEPYQAHQLFPCFDQPDLKAHFDLTVTAPADWKAIGNELVAESNVTGSERTTKFHTTPPLSTYLFFVGSGPFEEWTDKEGNIPLEIYARKSLAKYVDAENMFNTSKKGLRFYSSYFGHNYPFSKFGLVFAPEFGWGGMENPGAIVTNERNLFRGPVPDSRREGRDSLILHEMAHHWFGDLVTMEWWNDLWLNESFATYMSTVALDRAFGSKMVWQDFASQKTWGYWQDQLVTTHPIETKVGDVRTARGNFDGITYAKGAAALQQLHFYVGENAFQGGVQEYFRRHAFGNAERADFTGAIAQAGKINLDSWTHDWLQTAGVNRVTAKAKCAAGSLISTSISQTKSSSGTLSPHRTRLGFFRNDKGTLRLITSQDATYTGKDTEVIMPAGGTACPDLVFPNLDDKDYALFSLDEKSMKHVGAILAGGVEDPVLRLQTWTLLEQMVRDGSLPPLHYFDLALSGFASESDDGVLAVLLGRHSTVHEVFAHYLTRRERANLAPRFERTILSRMTEAENGSSRQMLFFDFFTRLAQTTPSLKKLDQWLDKKNLPAGIELDQERRWNLLLNLAIRGAPGIEARLEKEETADPSDLGKRMAYGARVAMPTPAAKAAFWEAVKHPEKIPPSTLRFASGEFHQPDTQELSEKYVKKYFDSLKKVDWKKSDQLVHVYFEGLFPGYLCRKALLKESTAQLKANHALTELARRSWLEANDELARCIRVTR